jgi:hypothetical protein
VTKPWRLTLVIGVAAALAVGAFGVIGQPRSQQRSALEGDARRAWATAAHCLLGGNPADAQAARAEQLARIALGADCDPAELTRPAEQRWPARCAGPLRAMDEA